MKNDNLINRDRLETMLSQVAQECYTFLYLDGGASCKNCPYKEACDVFNKIEISVCIGGNS